ncbi:hypothetical protein KC345_g12131, partial [Hortaea werneckii]
MKWAKENGAEAEFIDLPSSVTLGLQDVLRQEPGSRPELKPAAEEQGEPSEDELQKEESVYSRIARLAGEYDYDMYWERNYEHNASAGAYRAAILSFSAQMRGLSESTELIEQPREYAYNALREAYMRRLIRKKIAAGHQPEKIVVICGAYHAAALADLTDVMTDDELASLPSRSTKLTLMPYSYYKLSTMSGYGAGNGAPHYFQLMWELM